MLTDAHLNTYLNTILGIKIIFFVLLIINSVTKKKYKFVGKMVNVCRFISSFLISILVLMYFSIFTKAVDLVVPMKVAKYAFIYGLATFIECLHQVSELF
jgi:hypothetical protein